MERLKKFISKSRKELALATALASTSVMVFASETPSISATITTSFQQVVTDTLATISAIAPIGITVFAATFVWKYAVKFFKSVAK